jgi:hypothetical protein
MSEKWSKMPDEGAVKTTFDAIKRNGINAILAENGKEALAHIKRIIPRGAEVMSGSSVTLEEIGFKAYLKSGKHDWKDLYAEIQMEKDDSVRQELRRKSVTAEYYLGSVNAITLKGELVACDMSGSRIGAYLYAAKHLMLVSGANKITSNLEDAMRRVQEHAFPLTNQMVKKAYGFSCDMAKWVIINRETIENRTTLILVKEKLGI